MPEAIETAQIANEEASLYLVLDGGGARGIAHIAAWRVLDQMISKAGRGPSAPLAPELGSNRYKLAGVAGTSAGAVAAAFIAAGARPNDIIDPAGKVPLCDELGLGRFLDLFGIRGWRRLQNLRYIGSPEKAIRRDIERLKALIKGRPITGTSAAAQAVQNAAVPPPRFGAAIAFLAIVFLGIVGPELVGSIPAAAHLIASNNVDAPWFFFILWVALHVSLSLTAQWARDLERKAKQSRERHFTDWTRTLVHPIASALYAFGATVLLSVCLKLAENTPVGLFFRWLLVPVDAVMVGADAVLYALSLLLLVRQFLKGSIDPVEISDDLNAALCALVAKKCEWSEEDTKYIWTPKTGETSELVRKIVADPKHKITFQELYDETNIHLAVMTADVIGNEGFVFSTTVTPEEHVADAIAASLAIPLAFRAMKYKGRMLVDGGIVSSIPAWLHRRDRNLDPDCKILAVRIEAGEPDDWIPHLNELRDRFVRMTSRQGGAVRVWVRERWRKLRFLLRNWRLSAVWPIGLISNMLYTGAFGARALELDASDRLESVRLPSKLGLFDFDIGEQALVAELTRLEVTARLQIESRLWLCEDSFLKACAQIADLLRSAGDGVSEEESYIRMFWAERDGTAKSVRIKHTYKFRDQHFDDRLTMPFGTSMSAWAVERKTSQFAKQNVLDLMMAGHMNRYRRAAKWRGRAWCWTIPIVTTKPGDDEETYIGTLAIESDKPPEHFDVILGQEAETRSQFWMRGGKLKEPTELVAVADMPSNGKMKTLEDEFERVLRTDFVRLKVS